jgi:hypothetical protein
VVTRGPTQHGFIRYRRDIADGLLSEDNFLNCNRREKLSQNIAFFQPTLYSSTRRLTKTYPIKQRPINSNSTVTVPLQEVPFAVRREAHPRCELGRKSLVTLKMEAICSYSHAASYPRRKYPQIHNYSLTITRLSEAKMSVSSVLISSVRVACAHVTSVDRFAYKLCLHCPMKELVIHYA